VQLPLVLELLALALGCPRQLIDLHLQEKLVLGRRRSCWLLREWIPWDSDLAHSREVFQVELDGLAHPQWRRLLRKALVQDQRIPERIISRVGWVQLCRVQHKVGGYAVRLHWTLKWVLWNCFLRPHAPETLLLLFALFRRDTIPLLEVKLLGLLVGLGWHFPEEPVTIVRIKEVLGILLVD
jgi:hypothetical protein